VHRRNFFSQFDFSDSERGRRDDPTARPSHLANIGTLFAFVIVCAGVLVMRRTNPGAARPFRVPFVPVTPILGVLSCLLLMFSLPAA